jgi:hypothetical protein
MCTNSFIDIPAAGLGPPGGFCHALVGLKMPVKMTGFLVLAFFSGKEPAPAGSTSVRTGFIEGNYQSNPGSFYHGQLSAERRFFGDVELTFL